MKKPAIAKLDAQTVEVWKKVIDVQMHFNDLEMRIRNFALSVVLAVFAAFGFLLSHSLKLTIICFSVELYVLAPLAGALAVYLFYFMDYYWYHRLLMGAVNRGVAMEKQFETSVPGLGLTQAIGDNSPVKPSFFTNCLAMLLVWDSKYRNNGLLHSTAKIQLFYNTIITFLIILAFVSALVGGVTRTL